MRVQGHWLAGALVMTAAAGCVHETPACGNSFVGDRSKDLEVALTVVDPRSEKVTDLSDGQTLPLLQFARGGYALAVSVRAKNVDPCGAELRARVIDPESGSVLGTAARTVALYAGADGWARASALETNSVVPRVCPDYGSRDVHAKPHDIEVVLIDRGGRTATARTRVVPTCAHPFEVIQTDCVCNCSAGFYLGKCPNWIWDAYPPGPL